MGRETIVEHICDNICKYPTNVTDQAQLEDICNKCEINDYIGKMQLIDCTGRIHKGNRSFCLNCKRGGCSGCEFSGGAGPCTSGSILTRLEKNKEQLQKKFQETWFIERYKYWNNLTYFSDYKIDENTWEKHQFISLDTEGNILGYIGYSVDRETMCAYDLSILNFSDNKVIFGMDLGQALIEIFEKFKFRKLIFAVIVGNPIEKSYDKMVLKYGGRIVGIYKKDSKLIDGEFYDKKIYEVMREQYMDSKK